MRQQGLSTGAELLGATRSMERDLLAQVRELVAIESPSDTPEAVERAAKLVETWAQQLGGKTRLMQKRGYGPLLVCRFGGKRGRTSGASTRAASNTLPPLLLLGHLDTVWPMGTLGRMPFRIKDGRVWGPGVLDMKAGVVMCLAALRLLTEQGRRAREVILLLNSDEEVGSPVSRSATESLARTCGAVFVLEPAQGLAGAYKTARKGVAQYQVRIAGVAAHSGVDFERGHSAVLELARQLDRASAFTNLERGITVNPGVIGGGTRSNVVAAEAWADFDVRIARAADAGRVERLFRGLRPLDRACRVEVTGGLNRPPMERTPGTVALFRQAASIARSLGFKLEEAATGGGSDGNFTSALGVPTLDGMGAVGEGAHAEHESVLLESIVPRTALLAAMIGGLELG